MGIDYTELKNIACDKSVLYVEDDLDIRTVFGDMLKTIFKDVFIATNGKEGVEAYKLHNPDIIITDIKMEIMNGIDMLKEIRAINPNIKSIITTAFDDSNFLLEAISSGVNHYLIKPISMESLAKTIISACQEINNKKANEKIAELSKKLEAYNRELEERIEVETKKRVSQEQMLLQQSKMAQMGELMGVIAHQWKQPLSVISLVFHTLNDELDREERDLDVFRELFDDGLKQVSFLLETMDDFRNFLKPSHEKSNFSLKRSLENVLELMSALLVQSNTICNIKSTLDEPMVYGYENEIKNVFLNLIANSSDAIDSYREKNGLRKSEYIGEITVNIDLIDDRLLIEFLDNGGGIDEKIIARLFDKYVSSKGDKGTGLGLYMAKIIIEEHSEGKIWISNRGQGACVSIMLPKSTDEEGSIC